jgi:hypothetical protein
MSPAALGSHCGFHRIGADFENDWIVHDDSVRGADDSLS